MCKNCEKLKQKLEEERKYKEANYRAYKELKEKFEKLAITYCYECDMPNPLD